jgi:ubiquitin-protein ligase
VLVLIPWCREFRGGGYSVVAVLVKVSFVGDHQLSDPLSTSITKVFAKSLHLFSWMIDLPRFQQEFVEIAQYPLPNWIVNQADDVDDCSHWLAVIEGAPGTPYEGQLCPVDIRFPRNYPDDPPQIRFAPPISHPMVCGETGDICLESWPGVWQPATQIRSLLQGISELLYNPESFNWLTHGNFVDEEIVNFGGEDEI